MGFMSTPTLHLPQPASRRSVPTRRLTERAAHAFAALHLPRRYDDRPSFERFATPSDLALRSVTPHDLHR